MKRIFLILFIPFYTSCFAQINDSFGDGDYTNNPTWNGTDTLVFVNSNHALQFGCVSSIQNQQTAYLATPSQAINNAMWQCNVTLQCQTNENNYARFYLCSNQSNLLMPLNGYFIEIGGSENTLSLYKQNQFQVTSIITGPPQILTTGNHQLHLLCTRSQYGDWQLYLTLDQAPYPSSLGSTTDNTFQQTAYCALLCSFTAQCNNNFIFDNIKVTGTPGTTIDSDTLQFRRHDVVFSELMIDPTPSISLPEQEYLELYNRTDSAIDLTQWKLYGNQSFSTIAAGTIAPHSYALLCSEKYQEQFAPYGQVIGVKNWQTLTNTGKLLYLATPQNQPVTWVEYDENWYNYNAFKKEGGWSVERMDCNNLNVNEQNWTLSTDNSGGTPGQPNSVEQLLPDTITPRLLYYTLSDQGNITLYFNKEMNVNQQLSQHISSQPLAIDSIGYLEPQHQAVQINLQAATPELSTHITLTDLTCITNLPLPDTTISIYAAEPCEPTDIIFNEIRPNVSTNNVKYIELYNRSEKYIDLSQLQLSQRDNQGGLSTPITFSPMPVICAPNQYILLSTHLNQLYRQQHCQYEGPHFNSKLPSMPQDQGIIVLTDKSGRVIDELHYDKSMHHPAITSNTDVSLERINPDNNTNEQGNWQSASAQSNFGTPGYKNSQFHNNLFHTKTDYFHTYPESFTPNNDGLNDLLTIAYHLPSDGYLITIKIYTPSGIEVTTICNNLLANIEGTLFWNGTKNSNSLCPVGIYIVWAQASKAGHKTISEQHLCVIASS